MKTIGTSWPLSIQSSEVTWFGNRTLAIDTSYLPLFLSLFGFGRAECRSRSGKTTSNRFKKNGARIKAIYISSKRGNLDFGCHVPAIELSSIAYIIQLCLRENTRA